MNKTINTLATLLQYIQCAGENNGYCGLLRVIYSLGISLTKCSSPCADVWSTDTAVTYGMGQVHKCYFYPL